MRMLVTHSYPVNLCVGEQRSVFRHFISQTTSVANCNEAFASISLVFRLIGESRRVVWVLHRRLTDVNSEPFVADINIGRQVERANYNDDEDEDE